MTPTLRPLVAILLLLTGLVPRAQTIITIAGTPTVFGFSGAGGPATSITCGQTFNVAVDNAANVFWTDPSHNVIWKVNTVGIATIYAGTGTYGHTGDGGPATAAQLQGAYWLTVDNNGNIYFSENTGDVRKIDASGIITTIITVAQANGSASTGDGGPLSAATFIQITKFVPDNAGNFYISDYSAGVVRKVDNTGIIHTIAGTGAWGFSGDGGLATAAQLNRPYGVAFDNAGNIYIPDEGNNRIRKIDPSGIITTVAGNGTFGYSGDGGPATSAQLYGGWQVVCDASGDLYIDDVVNCCVRKVDPSGTITTYAGVGGITSGGYSGDGGPANAAKLSSPMGIAMDNGGNLYIADENNYIIRKVTNCLFAQVAQEPAAGTICVGANTNFTFTSTGSTGYQWQANTGSGWSDLADGGVYAGTTTNTLAITSAVAGMNATQYRCSLVNACGTITTVPAVLTVNTPSPPTVAISTPYDEFCAGATATFTATATNGGATPAYQWLVNNTNVGTNNPNYTTSGLNNGDVVACVLTSNSACATMPTATSNTLAMTIDPLVTPGISIAGPTAAICAGSPASFTATAANGGAAPSYQWQLNGANTGTNSATYTNSALNNGDVVSCMLTSNAVCATTPTAASNAVTMTVNPQVSPGISIAGPTGFICAGSPASFMATPVNGGSSPAFQWLVNGAPAGAAGPTYTNASLIDGDVVSCVMTSDAACLTTPAAVSNAIVQEVKPPVTASLSIAASTTTICAGTRVSFTATPVNGGSSPAYQWQVNGSDAGSDNPMFTTNVLSNGDVVTCILTSSLSCSSPASSQNQLVMTVNEEPTVTMMPDTTIGLGQSIVLQVDVTGPVTSYQWTPADDLDNPFAAAPVASPANTTTYQVTVSTAANCTAHGKVTIGVFKSLKMPSAFTPNGDGKNDLFRVPPSLGVKIIAFAVYDRWGARVFYTTNSSAGWDGALGGRPQAAGTYVWMIEYEDVLTGKPAQAKDTVILIR